jgi:peptide/nickel transport system substrate-binding protein
VPPGYGPWPFTQAELKTKYQKSNLVKAKALMAAAGQSKGFSVKLSTFSTPLDFQQIAAVIKSQLKAINIDVDIVAQESGTFASNNGIGNFEWDLTARGMRGDVDGYVNEYNPANAVYKAWYPLWKNVKVWRDVGNGKITLDPARRQPLYKDAQVLLQNDLPQIGIVQVNKFQVVNKRVQGMYVAFDDFNTGLRNNVWLAS